MGGRGERIEVALACVECEARNYKTTRKPNQEGQLQLKKFCPKCKHHTVHKETK
jgi:large subunit ribosomal protein L33